jgi:hypothetical protein
MKILLLFILLITIDCTRKEPRKPNGGLLLLGLSRSSAQFPNNQSTAEIFSSSANLTSDDSSEQGSMAQTNGSSQFLGRVVSISGNSQNGTITITNESYECFLGGTVTFNGSQTFTSPGADIFNRTTTISNGTRTISYSSCQVSSTTTINSGTLTLNQIAPDSGSTTMETQISSGSTSSGTLRRTLSNLKTTVTGTINVTASGARGSGSANITINQTATITNRVRDWTILNSRVSRPRLISRTGNITGTVSINGTSYNVNRTLDLNID